jgi:hypothetical protein
MNILLPFHDDSSLILARTIGDELAAHGATATYVLVIERQDVGAKVSRRQLNLYLPSGIDLVVSPEDLVSETLLASFDAIIICRLLRVVNDAINERRIERFRKRACFVAFWAGLDFFPEKGVVNRRHYDIVFLLREAHRRYVPEDARAAHIGRGHPYFVKSDLPKHRADGPILFASQSISPLTLSGRVHIMNLLVATALANPSREILVKLRHKTNENRHHAHKEVFSYEQIAAQLYSRLPSNIRFNDDSMASALQGAAGCIVCTSTAIIDALAAGVPSMVFLDYPGAADDPLCEPMRDEFADSGLICGARDVVSLDFPRAKEEWMEERFLSRSFYAELLNQIETFHVRRAAGGMA